MARMDPTRKAQTMNNNTEKQSNMPEGVTCEVPCGDPPHTCGRIDDVRGYFVVAMGKHMPSCNRCRSFME